MVIGIVIAIARELKAFLESDFTVETIKNGYFDVYHCTVNGNEVYATQSGCGKVDAAAATQMLISCYKCEKILNFGVTGALDRNLKVDDLFVVKGSTNYDFDTSPIDPVKKCQYIEFPDIWVPMDEELYKMAKSIRGDLKDAWVATGDAFVEKKEDKDELKSLGCNICDMEIAAIARIAHLNKAGCLSIKCISDTYDGDGGDFATNVTRSAAKAFALLREIILKL
ncbi:MAG: 5'-methylthioadenosine/S-adenosylhomocysteine nucleosidase [Bacilli bacterium]|nr:5'-methylthioadenosine/S-adenosylhomocysteine nucleosidase [Bacilli bacterium]